LPAGAGGKGVGHQGEQSGVETFKDAGFERATRFTNGSGADGLVDLKAHGAGEKVVDFPSECAFGLVEKKGDEDREGEFALAGEGGGFGAMLLDEIGLVQALKKLAQRGKCGAARVLRVVITWPWIWLLR